VLLVLLKLLQLVVLLVLLLCARQRFRARLANVGERPLLVVMLAQRLGGGRGLQLPHCACESGAGVGVAVEPQRAAADDLQRARRRAQGAMCALLVVFCVCALLVCFVGVVVVLESSCCYTAVLRDGRQRSLSDWEAREAVGESA
jgi:hypothetical protein